MNWINKFFKGIRDEKIESERIERDFEISTQAYQRGFEDGKKERIVVNINLEKLIEKVEVTTKSDAEWEEREKDLFLRIVKSAINVSQI